MRLVFALICLAAVAFAQTSTPVIVAATPNVLDAGGPDFTLTITLGAFVPAAVIKWSGTVLTPTSVSANTLTATVPAGLIAICGKYLVTVTNGQTSAVSNSFPIVVKPVLQSISPNVLPAGSGGTTVTAIGVGFSSNVHLTLNVSDTQSNLATAMPVPTTTLTAFVPASALNGLFKVSLFVTDATTGAVSQTLPITLTYASVSAIYPPYIFADIASYLPAPNTYFILEVVGANFAPGVQVLWDSTPLLTQVNASNDLLARVPADLVRYASADGTTTRIVGISVKNPGATASNSLNCVIRPTPYSSKIVGINPASAIAGGPAVTLTVTGEHYVQGSNVVFGGVPLLPTTFVSSTQLTATIPFGLLATPGAAAITVSTPGAVFGANSVSFPINAVSPTISKISPDSAVAGGPGFTMTVTGDGFVLDSKVSGVPGAATTYVSGNQLSVSVPASAIVNVGSLLVGVTSPGGLNSPSALTFTVRAPTPAITSLSPASVLAGGNNFTLTVTGSNFLSGATVAWNGVALPTTSAGATQLTASVSAALIAAPGTARITAVNAGPVPSNELSLSITSGAAASLAGLSPSSAAPGGVSFTLTLSGAAFTARSTAQWNGAPLVTTFVSASKLTAIVPAVLIATAGTANVAVSGDGATSNALPFSIGPPTPAATSAGILNAASFLPAIAPGALITVFGTNLAAGTAQFSDTPLPVSLGGTSVTINGTPAPLLFVSPEQVNLQVPYDAKVGTAKLIVQANNVPSPEVSFQVAAAGPGVFTQPQTNHVLARNLADGTINTAQTPARPGQYVTAYLTGQGLVDPKVTAGDVAPSNPPFPAPLAPVQVKVGGTLAVVQFAGLAPGFVNGLLQMNVLIPDVPPGELSFDVSIGGVPAAPTVISIAAR